MTFGIASSAGTGGTLSVEVLGVERLSNELLGRLLVEELEELKVVKLMSTLCGLRFIFWNVDSDRERAFGGLVEDLARTGLSNCGGAVGERRGVEGSCSGAIWKMSPS